MTKIQVLDNLSSKYINVLCLSSGISLFCWNFTRKYIKQVYVIAQKKLAAKLRSQRQYNFANNQLYPKDYFASNFIPREAHEDHASIAALK